ncbi:MAG TPA: 3-hydroxyacyl-CoA dehydrogenase NAD-binding domain-containing protein, partial [Mycobacteriales bacterium]|nr:3-hydroxyacyl-CoA dehydrogenase NAD-binding domain-containing protein [Mycobacteriales bacterium]
MSEPGDLRDEASRVSDGVFEKVGVVGGGTMGAGIAEVCARTGSEVVVLEVSDA